MKQLDIFDDGREAMLVNDLALALARGQLDAARAAAAGLKAEFADNAVLPAAALLIGEQAARDGIPFADASAALAAHEALQTQLVPAAVTLLGSDEASRWRAARQREFARRAERLPWQAGRPQAHAAAFFVAAGAWPEALAALAAIESWRRQPQALAWAAEARWRHHGPDAGWPLIAELAWLAPARAGALIGKLADASLARLAARFEADLEGEDFAWFPAWLLVEQPLLATALEAAQPQRDAPPEQAFKTLQALLRLERQGRQREIVEHRRRLRDLHPALFASYMRTR